MADENGVVNFWQCLDCIFGSNSEKNAAKHMEDTGHDVVDDDDEEL